MEKVGIIYGDAGTTNFNFVVSGKVKKLDYVCAPHEEGEVLAQVVGIQRRSKLSFDEVMNGESGNGKLTAVAEVIGYKKEGNIRFPRTPFNIGEPVYPASNSLIKEVLGLGNSGLYIGLLKNRSIPVYLDPDSLCKHLSILAKTGGGKSYAMGVIIEELLKKNKAVVIIDPHGEYTSLSNPSKKLASMEKFGIEPRSYGRRIIQYSPDVELNPDSEQIFLDGKNLGTRELMELLPSKPSGTQVGILYKAIKRAGEWNDPYTIQDIKEEIMDAKSKAKWNLLSLIEWLEDINVFSEKETPINKIVERGKCSIINFRGVPPDVQELVVARLFMELFEGRKDGMIPPAIIVVEEAHRYCPERGNAISSKMMRLIASEGRKFGLGLAVVSQRPARIEKNILSQCNTQLILKVTNPNDLKAITQSVEQLTHSSADEIQRLPIGIALLASPSINFPIVIEIRTRETMHGGKIIGTKIRKKKIKKAAKVKRESKAEVIHRVANRLGYVDTSEPKKSLKMLKEAALKMGDDPSKYLNAIAKLGKFCLDKPRCNKCPMKDKCSYYKNR